MGQCFSSNDDDRKDQNNLRDTYVVDYDEFKHPGGLQTSRVIQVLFFPDPAIPCRYAENCRRTNCTYAHSATSLSKLLLLLGKSTASLDVCVFTITCNEIADALLDAHKRGVRVRVISDDDQMASRGSDIMRLKEAGIAVKTDRSPYHMHNKFAIIDGRILINGSFNWTRQAVVGNCENVVIQDTPALVKEFAKEFESLWSKFERI